MKITCISDTHTFHEAVKIEPCDVLICSGDVSFRGDLHEVVPFLKWFGKQPAQSRLFVSGNHDWCFERQSGEELCYPYDIVYLENSSVEIDGVNFWGSPVTPYFGGWAFNAHSVELEQTWAKIPDDTNVVITHGPPLFINDKTREGDDVGCFHLRNRIKDIRPQLHVFGHVHEGYGVYQDEFTTYVNASICNRIYKPVNKPITIEL